MSTIKIKYKCAGCGIHDLEVAGRESPDVDVVAWMRESVETTVAADHRIARVRCRRVRHHDPVRLRVDRRAEGTLTEGVFEWS